VLGNIAVPVDGDWEQRITELYCSAWGAMIEIPGIAALIQQRPLAGPADAMDRIARQIMSESGWPAEDLDAAHVVLYIHLLGSVQLEHHLHESGSEHARRRFRQGLRVILAGLHTCRPSITE
jgi:hypothetical protein